MCGLLLRARRIEDCVNETMPRAECMRLHVRLGLPECCAREKKVTLNSSFMNS